MLPWSAKQELLLVVIIDAFTQRATNGQALSDWGDCTRGPSDAPVPLDQ
jgi:hypothetical protein